MALFTDGPFCDLDDLTAHDSQLLEVTNTEGIDVSRKIALAQDQLGVELTNLMNRLTAADQTAQATPSLNHVVVTSPLKSWLTARSLEMIYEDAYYNQVNDRYARKRDQFHAIAKRACEKLIETGVGIASKPVPRALSPVVSLMPGSLPDGVYYVTMAWVNDLGEEGASATPVVIALAANSLLVRPQPAPESVTGWNVYAGDGPATMVRQNDALLPLGVMWQPSEPMATDGQKPGSGQAPSYCKPVPRFLQRG